MKNWLKGTNAAVLSVAVIGIFIVLTVFLHSMKGIQWDLTANKKFTLADQTVTTLQKLDKPVHVLAFTYPGSDYYNRQVTDLLEEFHKHNSKLTYEEVDPKKNPTLTEQYKVTEYGTIIFDSNGKTQTVSMNDIFRSGQGQGPDTFSGEGKFTQALLNLASDAKKTVYFLTGHGELTSANASQLNKALQSENYAVKDLNLVKDAAIPQDADVVFVLAPRNDLSDKEAQLLKDYAGGKGKLMVSLNVEKNMDTWKNWNDILATVGVKNAYALAVENKQTMITDPLTIIPRYGSHEITQKLAEQDRITVLPGAIALQRDETKTDLTSTAILMTSDQAYGKTNINDLLSKQLTSNDIKKEDKDMKGPMNLAFAVETKTQPKAIVVGNGVFLSDSYFDAQGNKDFILNSVGWLAGQENSVTIRPREEAELQQVVLTPSQGNTIFVMTVVVIPLLFLLVGGFIWWRRRKG